MIDDLWMNWWMVANCFDWGTFVNEWKMILPDEKSPIELELRGNCYSDEWMMSDWWMIANALNWEPFVMKMMIGMLRDSSVWKIANWAWKWMMNEWNDGTIVNAIELEMNNGKNEGYNCSIGVPISPAENVSNGKNEPYYT